MNNQMNNYVISVETDQGKRKLYPVTSKGWVFLRKEVPELQVDLATNPGCKTARISFGVMTEKEDCSIIVPDETVPLLKTLFLSHDPKYDPKAVRDEAMPLIPESTATSNARTRLTEKAWSPLIIRKTTRFGFPVFVGIITDDDLNDLDELVLNFIEAHIDLWKSDRIQDKRNLGGMLTDAITEHYTHTEGVAVIMAIDKMMVSSLFGDFMNHTPCRLELYTLLSMMTNI